MLEQVDLPASSTLSLVPEAEYRTGPSQLSQSAYQALRQLERRLRTGAFDAVNIRGAQELVLRGLAHHARGGWRPTRDGLNYLSQHLDQGSQDLPAIA